MAYTLREKRIHERFARPKHARDPDARTVCHALGGNWYGNYGVAFCPAHPNSKTPALSLTNALDGKLLFYCHAGCSGRDVLAALRQEGHLNRRGSAYAAPGRSKHQKVNDKAQHRHRIRLAQQHWAEATPIDGTLGERYTRARGITCPLPQSLRYHPHCWHGPTTKCVPAMVAAVTLEAELVGIHRTYLAEPGTKAFGEHSKLMLGPCRGGAVRLSEGPGPLLVAEGIETALSLLSAPSDAQPRVWAALSTSGMAGLVLPEPAGHIVIAPDGDAPGVDAARKLAHRACAAGWRVRIMDCPVGRDWNDVWWEQVT